MVEPFSLASSAAGIISLGLQVCQQLVAYCQSYQRFDEDTRNISDKASRLRCPLENLREMIDNSQITNPDIARDLERKLVDLEKIVDHLQTTVNQYILSPTSVRIQDRIQQQLHRSVYPFRKSALREVAEDLDSLQAAIQTTLHIYSAQKMVHLGLVQEKILREVQKICLTLQDSPYRAIPPPSLVQSWGGFLNDHAQSMRSNLDLATQKAPIIENFNDHCPNPGHHRRNRVRYRAKSTLRSYQYLSTLFRVVINMSFSLSVGAGAFSISPSLRCQTISDLHTSLPYLLTKELREDRASGESCAPIFESVVNACIRKLQEAFAEKKAAPTDAYIWYNQAIPIVDAVIPWSVVRWRDELPSLRRLTRFLIECGSMPDNTLGSGVLTSLLSHIPLEEEDLSLVTELVDLGGPLLLSDLPLSTVVRRNLKYIVSKDEGLVSFSDNAMVIFRESQGELQRAAELGKISPVDIIYGSPSLLSMAFGWPQGVKILLNFGADAKRVTLNSLSLWTRHIEDMDVDFNAYYESTRLVLEAGCIFGVSDINHRFSRKLQSLLANELAQRRWKLWELLESQLPSQKQLNFYSPKDTVPDIHAAGTCKALAAQGRVVDPHLQVGEQTASVYHEYLLSIETMEELWNAGFRDLNCSDSSGVTPLMIIDPWAIGARHMIVKRAAWMISKGADTHRRLPRSNATVAHLLSAELTGILLFLCLNGSLQPGNLVASQFWMEKISPHQYNIFLYHLSRDKCACACCPDGCTILSVALRQVCRWKWWPYVSNRSLMFRRLLQMLVDFTHSGPSANHTIIRCLSFDAIGLRHICCIEIEDQKTVKDMGRREDSEILEILDEESRGIEDLEQLVLEFEKKFDELGLQILEFLEHFWHKRMVEYLSKRDPYNEEHNRALNIIGIDLRAEERITFDRVSLLIGDPYDEDHNSRATMINLEAGENLFSNYMSLLLHAQGFDS